MELRQKVLQSYYHFTVSFFKYVKNQRLIPAKHHKIIFDEVDKIVRGKSYNSQQELMNRLMINIAPRSGKTMMCSVFLIAYIAALSQGRGNIMLASYSTKIAKISVNDAVDIIESPLFQKLFPGSQIASRTDGKIRFVNGGNVYPVSPQSSLTGLGAGSNESGAGKNGLIIIDDLVNSADALSDTVRSGANDWYFESLLSRRNHPDTPILCISQRLHAEDLPGTLIEREPEKWNRLIIPMVNDKGESFWPEKYRVEDLAYMKKTNPFTYFTQYQQSPVNKGEGIIKEHFLTYYSEAETPAYAPNNTFITADTAMKTGQHNDWSVFQVWRWVGSGALRKIYLIDQVRGKWEAPALLDQARLLKTSHNPQYFAIEDKASGTGLIQQLRGEWSSSMLVDVQRGAKENKTQRLHDASIYMAQGRVLLPDFKPWLNDLTNELLSFTELMTHAADDQADALADGVKFGFMEEAAQVSIGDWGSFGMGF